MAWENARVALDLLAGKWTLPILGQLREGGQRLTELREDLAGPSAKVLQATLRQLELHEIVDRRVVPTSPPRVEYGLTSRGQRLAAVLDQEEAWAKDVAVDSETST